MGWLEGDVALITGGGSGIGRALVERFLCEGAQVATLEKNDEQANSLKEEYGERIVVIKGDVTQERDNELALSKTLSAYGKLDCFIGNAGIWDYMMPIMERSPKDISAVFDEIMAVNVKGNLLGARVVAPALLQTGGNMIFTVSNSGFYAGGGGVVYTASKHALVGMIRQLAFEFAPSVRVNGVAPGGTLTNLKGSVTAGQGGLTLTDLPDVEAGIAKFAPLQIAAQPEDHTGHYVLLASRREARMTTGAVLHSDGGLEVRGVKPDTE